LGSFVITDLAEAYDCDAGHAKFNNDLLKIFSSFLQSGVGVTKSLLKQVRATSLFALSLSSQYLHMLIFSNFVKMFDVGTTRMIGLLYGEKIVTIC